ncbi:MAG: hypothetical protein AB1511_10820, partial [Deinococcota bacterium]
FLASLTLMVVGIVVFGLTSGALTFGAANGQMARSVNLAQAFTPLGVGVLFTWTGSAHVSLLLLAGSALAAAGVLLTARRLTAGGGWTQA